MSSSAPRRPPHATLRALLVAGLVSLLPGCFLLDLATSGGGDDTPRTIEPSTAVGLLVSDGERLLLLGQAGLEDGSAPLPAAVATRGLASSADRSRVVFIGADGAAGEESLWLLQNGIFTQFAAGVLHYRVAGDARWVWTESAGEGLAGAALYHHGGGGTPEVTGSVGGLELLGFSPDDAFAVLKQGTTARLIFGDDREVPIEPELGDDWTLGSVRHDGVLLRPGDGSAGTWFGITGERAGAEDTVPKPGHTLEEGELTWRAGNDTIPVASGLPSDVDDIVSSDLSFVLARRGEALAYYDYLGTELGSYEPVGVANVVDGPLPNTSRITTIVPMGARAGVFVTEHVILPDEAGLGGRSYATIHEYALDETNALGVRTISIGPASTEVGHLGQFLGSAYVAWVEGPVTVAFHNIESGVTERVVVDTEVFFESHHTSDGVHY